MRNRLIALWMGVMLGLVGGVGVATAAPGVDEEKVRVLVITGGHAYEEAAFEALFAAIPDVVTQYATLPEAAALLNPSLAESQDVIVFYDMWVQGFSPEQQQAFLQLLDHGIGVVALHHTLAGHQQWPEYAKMIGGKFQLEDRVVNGQTLPRSTYDHDQDIPVQIADAQHPITRGLQHFEIRDETYGRYDTHPGVHVLLTTEHPKSDRELAWTNRYGHSRVVYIQLGHDHFAYEHPTFRELVARSIRWTAGRVADPQSPSQPLFNGRDLTGWKAEGEAVWEVRDGLLIGRQGPGNTPGDLFTTASFDDFELTVTYRVVWPANSGVWYRYQGGEETFQADILEYENPFALSGSLYRPGVAGEPFAAVNTDATIIDREGWNTMQIRAVGNRHLIHLNGHKVVDVRADGSDRGRIGFQVHPGDEFGTMQIIVREIAIRPL